MRTSTARLILALTLALAIAGCGSKSTPQAMQAKAAGPVKKATNPANALSPYLVTAAVTGKTGASLLQLKYELGGRPEVGDPVDVDLVIVPATDTLDRFAGSIQGDDGLEVVDGATIATTEKPAFGAPIHHAIKVVAKRDGIFTLSVNLTLMAGGESFAPVYSLPIIAGNGQADVGAPAVSGQSAPKPAPAAAAQ